MRYLALAADFDGVIARHGRMSDAAPDAIKRLRLSGRRMILVTGRRLDDLRQSCPDLSAFDCVVAENGGTIYDPRTREETVLAHPPNPAFIERLKERNVEPLEIGRVIVSTRQPHLSAVLQAIRETGLELHVIFNRDSVMVLPGGVNKSTGLDRALRKLGLSAHEVVGIGDSENDHSFLDRCECAVTVANAVPSIRAIAAAVSRGEYGEGFAELVDELIATDFSRLQGRTAKNLLPIGRRSDGTIVTVPPYGHNLLIAGPSGSGKSTVTAGIVERLIDRDYQVCIIDPEGDYGAVQNVVTIGGRRHPLTVNEVLSLLEDPKITLNANLLGIPLADRPAFFGQLFPNLHAMRIRTGRPHWIILDEAHHMLPAEWSQSSRAFPQGPGETIFITVHPEHLNPSALACIDTVIAVGPEPEKTLKKFADAVGRTCAWSADFPARTGTVVAWFHRQGGEPFTMEVLPGRSERIRHHRKYAEGDMRHRSFFFRGPGNRQNLRAQNLAVFSQIAEGIDEETWLFHLRRGDYSRWFRAAVKDRYLADQAERIERRPDLQTDETRKLIRSLIEARYTLPE